MTDPAARPVLSDQVLERFEAARPRLRSVAVRILGSGGDADGAVQEAYLRLDRADAAAIENLDGWLTTVTARVCLNMLRDRPAREVPLDPRVADPVVAWAPPTPGPESELALAESVDEALSIVLDTLSPAERVAFVLHDVFALPFEEIARIVDRTPAAVRQLASRARRRVASDPAAGSRVVADTADRRAVVDAFFRAARAGDLGALVGVLDPDVVLRSDAGVGHPGTVAVRGAATVARRATMFAAPGRTTRAVWVGADPAVVVTVDGETAAVMRFVLLHQRIVRIDALTDPTRLAAIDLSSPADRDRPT